MKAKPTYSASDMGIEIKNLEKFLKMFELETAGYFDIANKIVNEREKAFGIQI